jgi:hypothetical protein
MRDNIQALWGGALPRKASALKKSLNSWNYIERTLYVAWRMIRGNKCEKESYELEALEDSSATER